MYALGVTSCVRIMSCADFLTISSAYLSALGQLFNHTGMSWVMMLCRKDSCKKTLAVPGAGGLSSVSSKSTDVALPIFFFFLFFFSMRVVVLVVQARSWERHISRNLKSMTLLIIPRFDIDRGRIFPLPPCFYHQMFSFGGAELSAQQAGSLWTSSP